jgi:lactate dehydrogenase-like 2-hydroxyacid dehydrogenase
MVGVEFIIMIYRNTDALDEYILEKILTKDKQQAKLILLGSDKINLDEFPNVEAIYRNGVGIDNVPFKEAHERKIRIGLPSDKLKKVLYEEVSNYTCNIIFKMNFDTINKRQSFKNKRLLVIGIGHIGGLVYGKMKNFINVDSYDKIYSHEKALKLKMELADFISLHIPMTKDNVNFIDKKKLSWMKDGAVLINTARGEIVNQEALYYELRNERIKAFFDTMWTTRGRLAEIQNEHFRSSPHIASNCHDFMRGCYTEMMELYKEIK